MELRDVNSLEDTAAYLGVTPTVLGNIARVRKIGSLKIGRTRVFPREVILEYVEGNTIRATPPNPMGLTPRAARNLARRGWR